MVNEAYCSFEVSKLLKEKGFNESCRAVYEEKILRINTLCDYLNSELSSYVCAPTHQMAMKWLRGKGIHMSIDTVISSSGNIYFNIDTYSEDSGWNHPVDFYNSYEEAVEAALKYCLENLI